MKVTHVWTQNSSLSKIIAKSCLIDNVCSNPKKMLDEVDALIIARDDWKSHFKLSISFLKKNIPTLIDKPLTLSRSELTKFKPYLKKGILMSCSGLRFSSKINKAKREIKKIGELKLVKAEVINDLEKYGVHMLDIINRITKQRFKKVSKISKKKDFYKMTLNNDIPVELKCLGKVEKTFKISFIGKKKSFSINFNDNFHSFFNMLKKFEKMIVYNRSQIDYLDTINIMKTLIAAKNSKFNQFNNIKDV